MDASSTSDPAVDPVALGALLAAAFGWFLAANLVGLLLALLLVAPGLGALLGPLGFGRWVPLHHAWHLHGWCSLPLVAVLLHGFGRLGRDSRPRAVSVAAAWSAALATAGISVLGGDATGLLFLEFPGPSLALWIAALAVAWLALAAGRVPAGAPAPRALRWALLVALAPVPVAFALVVGPGAGPPVNPHSGGATGHNLLASTLGLMACLAAVPPLLGLRAADGRRPWLALAWGMAPGILSWLLVGHGDASHREPAQVAALGSLLAAVPGLGCFLAWQRWTPAARPWVRDAVAWWALLVASGWATFLPGALERSKFTQVLVAHAHLAMGGFLTSLLVGLCAQLASGALPGLGQALGRRGPRLAWQGAMAAMIVVLLALGLREGASPLATFRADLLTRAGWLGRLVAGAVMVHVSAAWFAAAVRGLAGARPLHEPASHEPLPAPSR